MNPSKLTLREQKKIDRKQKILDESMRLFSEKGFDNTTIADIVEACGMARGTFYNYYTDTQTIMEELIHQINNRIIDFIGEIRKNNSNIEDFTLHAFKAFFEMSSTPIFAAFNHNNQGHIRTISYSSKSMTQIIEIIFDVLKNSPDIKLKNDLDIKLLAVMMSSSASEVFLHLRQSELEVSTDYLAQFMTQTFLYGVLEKAK